MGSFREIVEPPRGRAHEAARNAGQALKVDGAAMLIEYIDRGLAERIATHADTRALCLRAGDRHLVVRAESESAFRGAVHGPGYGIAAGSCGDTVAAGGRFTRA